ncbi:MAG: aspartate-semialdehyde dehydrogenase [Candidatus Cloacimonetes bacterium]|nr:aspartate-semialdehyde dehydrogenase [Candidatus Cloacimonadota bacterium]
MSGEYRVAVLGATGVVGQEMVKVLEERNFPVASLRLLATERSAGKELEFRGEAVKIEKAGSSSFRNIDIALFSAGSAASRKFAPLAVKAGAVVIDNSSAFRMDNQVPLVVPEVNSQEIAGHNGIIANPNCSTIQLVVVLKPLLDKAGLQRVIVSTYQSVSGTGKDAVRELQSQTGALLRHRKAHRNIYPHQIAFNIIPHIGDFEDSGYTMEEMKMVHETRKILDMPDLAITATTARVPVFIGHTESVYVETVSVIPLKKLILLLLKSPGIKLVDDTANNKYPLPIMTEIYDEVLVGRIRRDLSIETGLNMWIVANNLRKGAALNAVQIAELLPQDKADRPEEK